jgi:glycosyltransferase involved in cell wall biosynthesis
LPQLKIALVSLNDSGDVRQWSGLNFYIARALAAAGAAVHPVGPFTSRWNTVMRVRQRWYDLTRRHYHAVLDPYALNDIGARARAAIPDDADAVLAVSSYIAAALGPLDIPLVSWDDATNAAMTDYYPDFRRMADVSRRQGDAMGQRAADAVSLAIYTSEWAADSARRAYGLSNDRIAVVPFGANLGTPPDPHIVRAEIAARPRDRCGLLWIGVDWERKGGPAAVEITRALREDGIPATLTVAGCEPPGPLPEFVRRHGFISKTTGDGEKRLGKLYASAHAFVMPSQAEAFGLVYAEAAAFGVPSVAIRTGGVPAIIIDGETGILENPDASPRTFAKRLAELWRNPSLYRSMCVGALERYGATLNWGVSGKTVLNLIEARLRRAQTQ